MAAANQPRGRDTLGLPLRRFGIHDCENQRTEEPYRHEYEQSNQPDACGQFGLRRGCKDTASIRITNHTKIDTDKYLYPCYTHQYGQF